MSLGTELGLGRNRKFAASKEPNECQATSSPQHDVVSIVRIVVQRLQDFVMMSSVIGRRVRGPPVTFLS